ncbi:FHA domain containing protein [Trichomonas vaginalis G3]|uniref:FHA domain containing protein n=1 Tax=Trichomonas vaginalis (strain ATCC PRA-98 / G3) TaxID=412133 RepID=A2DYT5_TRIV3|nr:production of miRNAs protein [Trichomonas vaginalis G3]EAY14475.1 FHA domain containing protein [Trichomonas vaginalis G3]KAI5519655.1 production of miRNAs protein [Trichomonas vaginalis G3]|eukprot:XP_001326698.1 FHA domain containing protein [Trichomonas vaginalis G3]
MHHEPKKLKPFTSKNLPDFNIKSLYSERVLVRKEKKTKYLLPFDSIEPGDKNLYYMHISVNNSDDIITYDFKEPATLIGREHFCDIRFTHKIISRQHCVIQFRNVKANENQEKLEITPYIFDMGTKNGTYINDEQIPSCQYVQLLDGDIITFDKRADNQIIIKFHIQNNVDHESDSDN